jgi:dTDP-4-dehydrorhamnose reductase
MVGLRLLVTGASGLLGRRVVELALLRGHEVYAVYKEHVVGLGVPIRLDITDRERLMEVVLRLRPDVIIHTAAFTDVDGCEVNRELAWRVNAEATGYVAEAAARVGSHLVYVSTDYVFDGERGLYREEDRPNPINYYGYTKLMGEEFVRERAGSWCIVRTSVVYGWSVGKLNFATWLIDNLGRGREVRVVTDQFVSPTLNTNLAEMLLEIAERGIVGVLHTAGASRVSRYEFAVRLAEVFGLNNNLVRPVRMSEMAWKAKRPRDSSLDVSRARAVLSAKPMELDQALLTMKKEKEYTNKF